VIKLMGIERDKTMYRKTYVEVDVDNIKSNVKNIMDCYKGYEYYIGVVKGNAYGHGTPIAKYMVEAGVNYLAVSSLEEALEIREFLKDIPILCLEPIGLEFLDVISENKVTMIVHEIEYFKELMKMIPKSKIKVHIKLDTGMNRLGVKDKEDVNHIYKTIRQNENYELEGIYTHMSTTGIRDEIWDRQIARFKVLTTNIDLKTIPIVHIAKSATLINHPKIDFATGARLGIIVYGYKTHVAPKKNDIKSIIKRIKQDMYKKKMNISETTEECQVDLKPGFKVVSEIMQIKKISKGESMGYGLTCVADRDILTGVLPIGYADGVNVKNVRRAVDIAGKRFKIIGTVTMNMIIVEVDETVKVGDKVNVFGGAVSIREAAMHTGVNQYNICTTISPLLPRIYKSGDNILETYERE